MPVSAGTAFIDGISIESFYFELMKWPSLRYELILVHSGRSKLLYKISHFKIDYKNRFLEVYLIMDLIYDPFILDI